MARCVPLALVVDAIVAGRQPRSLSGTRLLETELPIDWSEREVLFGRPPERKFSPRGRRNVRQRIRPMLRHDPCDTHVSLAHAAHEGAAKPR